MEKHLTIHTRSSATYLNMAHTKHEAEIIHSAPQV